MRFPSAVPRITAAAVTWLLLCPAAARAQAPQPILYVVSFGNLTQEAVDVINTCCGQFPSRAVAYSDANARKCPQSLIVCEYLRLEESGNQYRIHNVHSMLGEHQPMMVTVRKYNDLKRRTEELMTNLKSMLMCHDIGVHRGTGNKDSIEDYCQRCGRPIKAPSVTDKKP